MFTRCVGLTGDVYLMSCDGIYGYSSRCLCDVNQSVEEQRALPDMINCGKKEKYCNIMFKW